MYFWKPPYSINEAPDEKSYMAKCSGREWAKILQRWLLVLGNTLAFCTQERAACASLWWLLPSKWQWFIPFSLCLEKDLIWCKPSCLWIFLSIRPFIWDPGHDNSYSNCGMLIRWKNVHISYLHFNWEIWPRYIICFNVICVRILKGWQYITVLDKRHGIKGEGTIHGNMSFRILISANICFSMEALKLPFISWFSCPKLFAFYYWHWSRILAHLLALKCSFYNGHVQQTISMLTSNPSALAVSQRVYNGMELLKAKCDIK